MENLEYGIKDTANRELKVLEIVLNIKDDATENRMY